MKENKDNKNLKYVSFKDLLSQNRLPSAVRHPSFNPALYSSPQKLYGFLSGQDSSSVCLSHFLQLIRSRKEELRDYILHNLPEDEKIRVVQKIIMFNSQGEWSALGELFWLRRGLLSTSLKAGTLGSFALFWGRKSCSVKYTPGPDERDSDELPSDGKIEIRFNPFRS